MARRRIKKELAELIKDPPQGISVSPVEKNIEQEDQESEEEDRKNYVAEWKCVLIGPEDSPYEGGKFILEILFGQTYPYHPPKITFKTSIFHPNISGNGAICVYQLRDGWTPALTVSRLLFYIGVELMVHPCSDDALNTVAGSLFATNRPQFNVKARQCTLKYAMEPQQLKQLNQQTQS